MHCQRWHICSKLQMQYRVFCSLCRDQHMLCHNLQVIKPQLATKKPCDGAQLHADRRSTISERKHSTQAGLTCFSQHLSTLTRQLHV